MIVPKVCLSYASDGTDITVTDDTKAYDVKTNKGGYGVDNKNRDILVPVLQVFKQPYKGDRTFVERHIGYEPTFSNSSISKYLVNYIGDGWYIFIYSIVELVSNVIPKEGLIFYDNVESELKQYNSDLAVVDVFDFSVLEDESKYPVAIVNELAVVRLKTKYSSLALDYFDCKVKDSCGCDEKMKNVEFLYHGILGALDQFQIASFEAQNVVERLLNQYDVV